MSTSTAEIKATISDLYRRSIKLGNLARDLAEEYGLSLDATPTIPDPATNGRTGNRRARTKRSGRKEQIANYLRVHGPTRSRDLLDKLKLTAGTLYRVLRDPEFKSEDGGVWSVVEKSATA